MQTVASHDYTPDTPQRRARPTVKVLVSTKADVEPQRIESGRGRGLVEELGMLFAETSALTGQGVEVAFTTAAQELAT